MNAEIKAPFEHWCVVELFGRDRIAGLVTEETLGGSAFLRVEIPAVGEIEAHTRYFGGGAIYSLSVVAEDVARSVAASLRRQPVAAFEIPALRQRQLGFAAPPDDLPSTCAGCGERVEYCECGEAEDLMP